MSEELKRLERQVFLQHQAVKRLEHLYSEEITLRQRHAIQIRDLLEENARLKERAK